jgi:hypothetical protein
MTAMAMGQSQSVNWRAQKNAVGHIPQVLVLF